MSVSPVYDDDPQQGDLGIGRREQILNAAQKLFALRGYRETNLNDVALGLGFRRQAVYHYFRSKDEILYELMLRAGHAVDRSSQSALSEQLPPEEALHRIVRNHVLELLNNIEVFRIQFSELPKLSGERADQLRAEQAAYVKRIADVIVAGQRCGVFREVPPMAHALLIVGMCNWTTEWFSDGRSQVGGQEVAEYAARLAVSGISMSPGGPTPKHNAAC
ncbi:MULTISPECIES: TetR/AcrR family transcriptional regulator [unclassified Mycobacterium]|uniref:TetR/AcrR family transcriptional regulator n=1 Tax=unclassified Mycobacterium TaxID=2642494 RepID=UPI0029C66282|nr:MULTISPECIES: TetR/AcrR family transcriptional regulator [unclassified Mycobacterium]